MKSDGHVVSVIIPTVGRDTLAQCQAALTKQTRPPDEVIVIVDHDRRGAAWARNEGIRRAKGDILAFTDDDTIPSDDWLERLVLALDRHQAVAAGGALQETDPLLNAIRSLKPLPDRETVDAEGLVGGTGNIAFMRTWLDDLQAQDGYVFNERFTPCGEDWELIWRLRRRGATMVYVPNPVIHLRRATWWQHCRHRFQRGVGIAKLFHLQRSVQTDVIVQDSLLWGKGGKKARPQWFAALWLHAVGPFNVHEFHGAREFALYWIGEKFRAAGFLWGLAQAVFQPCAKAQS